jgi:hypothetical protein
MCKGLHNPTLGFYNMYGITTIMYNCLPTIRIMLYVAKKNNLRIYWILFQRHIEYVKTIILLVIIAIFLIKEPKVMY